VERADRGRRERPARRAHDDHGRLPRRLIGAGG
jgi:hypothetical protein